MGQAVVATLAVALGQAVIMFLAAVILIVLALITIVTIIKEKAVWLYKKYL